MSSDVDGLRGMLAEQRQVIAKLREAVAAQRTVNAGIARRNGRTAGQVTGSGGLAAERRSADRQPRRPIPSPRSTMIRHNVQTDHRAQGGRGKAPSCCLCRVAQDECCVAHLSLPIRVEAARCQPSRAIHAGICSPPAHQ